LYPHEGMPSICSRFRRLARVPRAGIGSPSPCRRGFARRDFFPAFSAMARFKRGGESWPFALALFILYIYLVIPHIALGPPNDFVCGAQSAGLNCINLLN
jgi:hypothetical protein